MIPVSTNNICLEITFTKNLELSKNNEHYCDIGT